MLKVYNLPMVLYIKLTILVLKLKVIKKYSLVIAHFGSMHTFQMRFTITLAIIRPEHSRTISGPRGLYTPVLPNNFSRRTQGRNCPKPGTHFTVE